MGKAHLALYKDSLPQLCSENEGFKAIHTQNEVEQPKHSIKNTKTVQGELCRASHITLQDGRQVLLGSGLRSFTNRMLMAVLWGQPWLFLWVHDGIHFTSLISHQWHVHPISILAHDGNVEGELGNKCLRNRPSSFLDFFGYPCATMSKTQSLSLQISLTCKVGTQTGLLGQSNYIIRQMLFTGCSLFYKQTALLRSSKTRGVLCTPLRTSPSVSQ